MQNTLLKTLTLAALGCIGLLGYVKSQWPAVEPECFIPPGKIQRHPFMGTEIRYIKTSNEIFIPYLAVDKEGRWHGKRE